MGDIFSVYGLTILDGLLELSFIKRRIIGEWYIRIEASC